MDELRIILEKLQTEEITIDDLSKNIKRAEELLTTCKTKLREVEKDISSLKDEK